MPNMPVSGYLTSVEAAHVLGIKRATLYSYASRGMIRIAPADDGRKRMYLASDVEALRLRAAAARGHTATAATALDWGQPVLESSITSIDVDGPNYRGHPALELVERGVAYEAVAQLLWGIALPERAPAFQVRGLGADAAALEALVPPGAHPHAVLATVVSVLAAADPLRHATNDTAELSRARRLIRRLAASLALAGPRTGWAERVEGALSAPTLAEAVLVALGVPPTPDAVADVDATLVLCADHELNASSFAARVAAGTGADLYACVQAALAALSGPRHGGAPDQVEALLEEAEEAGSVAAAVGERFRLERPVPGFGHRLYPDGDPRAEALLARVTASDAPSLSPVVALVEAMAEAAQPAPTLDIGLVAIARAHALPRHAAAALFAIGRSAGWVAHAREQRAAKQLLRPRARYVGP